MKDNAFKKSLKLLARWRYNIDLSITRFLLKLEGEPKYIMRGECCSCGTCCETPMIRTFAVFFYFKSLRWLFLAWHRRVNGFELIREIRIKRTFIFRCTHFDKQTKQCDSYSSRPGMCRDYPKNILYNTPPNFLIQCTFSALAENAKEIQKSLEGLDLPPEKLERVKKEFFVDDQ